MWKPLRRLLLPPYLPGNSRSISDAKDAHVILHQLQFHSNHMRPLLLLHLPLILCKTTSAPEVQDQAALRREEFITGLTKRVEGLVSQPPPVQKRRPKAPPPTSAPRRSRRKAGLHAEFAGIPDSTGARKTVIRSLDIALDQEHVDQKVLNDYAKLFGHPLSESHIQALAALFGWTVPVECRSVSAAIQC